MNKKRIRPQRAAAVYAEAVEIAKQMRADHRRPTPQIELPPIDFERLANGRATITVEEALQAVADEIDARHHHPPEDGER